MTLDEARALFPVMERFAYLNAGTLGPLSRPTLAAMEDRLRFDEEQGRGGHGWFMSVLELRARVRGQIASLVGTSPGQVALTSSTTDGCNIVLSGLELGPDDEVVTTDSEHPGLLLPLHVSGARVRVAEVAARPTADALGTILSCITPRTRLLALSHVLWTTGQVMPVHELKRESGLPVLVDGAQSVGAIAVGAVALSAVALGFIAIGRLVIGRAKIKRLEIGELRVTRLHVTESIITPSQSR